MLEIETGGKNTSERREKGKSAKGHVPNSPWAGGQKWR